MLLFIRLDHRATRFHRYPGGGGLLVFRIGGFAHLVSHADGIGERILYGRSFRTAFRIGIRGRSHIADSAWCGSGLDQRGCYAKRGILQLGLGLQRFGHRRVGCLACSYLLRTDAEEPSLYSLII